MKDMFPSIPNWKYKCANCGMNFKICRDYCPVCFCTILVMNKEYLQDKKKIDPLNKVWSNKEEDEAWKDL